jgi:DNA-directed RNA polymerase specialized sigma24 family protein
MAADVGTTLEQDLIERARGGDRSAFVEIVRREVPAAWRLAVAVTRSPTSAGPAVARAIAKVVGAGAPGTDPRASLRPRILAATRQAALDGDGTSTPLLHALPSGAAYDSVTMQAYRGLPERWRAVLWLTDVERLQLVDAAAALDLSQPATADLAERARAGLRERFTLAHLAVAGTPDCERVATRLDAYADEDLSIREANKVRRHLDGCEPCRDRLAELDDLIPSLRRSAPPIPATLAAEVEKAWAEARVTSAGPLHLTLPSGRQVPAWIERAVAGAAAAVITIGISGAIIAGGRSKPREDHLARDLASESPSGADGESALGTPGDLPLLLPDGSPVPTFGGASAGGGPNSSIRPAGGHALPRSIAPTTSTTTPRAGAPTAPTAGPDRPAPAPLPLPGDQGPAAQPDPTTIPVPEPLAPVVQPVIEPLPPVTDSVEDTVDQLVDVLRPLLGG